MSDITPIKPKRGRKPKALSNAQPEIALVTEEVSTTAPAEKITIIVSEDVDDVDATADASADTKPLPKKRGRKPKNIDNDLSE